MRTTTQPYGPITPVIDWMKFQCSCYLNFESNFQFQLNLPAYTVFSLVPMGLIRNSKTPCTVGKLAMPWWYHSWCQDIIQHYLRIASVFPLVNTGILILIGEASIFHGWQLRQLKISSRCQLLDDNTECLRDSSHFDHKDWVQVWC
jgi:hypothetical protein